MVAFIHFKEAGDPQLGRAGKQSTCARDIQIAGPAQGKADVAHGLERHTHQHMNMLAFRLDVHLDGHVFGNILSKGKAR